MKRKYEVMHRILRHELSLCRALTVPEISQLPDYQERHRGKFVVVRWVEKTEQGSYKIVVQVFLRHCLGMSTCDAGGIFRGNTESRDLEFYEYAEYR